MRAIELGVRITDAAVEEKVTTIFCTPVARDRRCPDCGRDGRYRYTVTRALTICRWPATRWCCGSPCPVIAVFPLSVGVRCSIRISVPGRRSRTAQRERRGGGAGAETGEPAGRG